MRGKNKETQTSFQAPTEKLPYVIELWNVSGTEPERILARALRQSLARAIFKAAQIEHPERKLRLCQGHRVIAESGHENAN
jgi:hypothetical protein